MNYSKEVNQILKRSKEVAEKLLSEHIGTEHLLIAMYESKESIMRFLFEEDKIDMESILKSYYRNISDVKNNLKYTDNFKNILEESSKIAIKYKSKYIYDEHLFYSMLTNDCTGNRILKDLKIDFKQYILDVKDIFNIDDTEEYPYLIDMKEQKNNHKYIPRGNYIERIIYILNRKQKHNPLIIGNPGVGKTAIVEGLSKIINQPIYQLNIGRTMSSTKYRGELEEKIVKTIDFVIKNDAILFIDEIHNIVNSNNSEGTLDIANILKPYLTRPEIKIIGSTTLEEYYSYFNKDKALSRRFQNIFIDEPDEEETKEILLGIKKDYEEFHNIKYDTNTIKQIIKYANIYFPNKTFPDKAIDLLDELGSRNKKPYKTTLKQIIKDYSGIYTIEENRFYSIKLCYPELKKYYLPLILLKDNNKNNICVIKATKSFQLDKFKLDLKKIFNIKVENILTIDLKYYNDITSLNNLIGSSKGYVGYNEGGLLTEHILKYPISVIYMKNFGKSNYTVESFFKNLFTSKHIVDSKNRTIYLRNVIFIYEDFDSNKVIGFKNQSIKKEYIYDIEI